MSRPYISMGVQDLESLYEKSRRNPRIVRGILGELRHRNTNRSQRLKSRILSDGEEQSPPVPEDILQAAIHSLQQPMSFSELCKRLSEGGLYGKRAEWELELRMSLRLDPRVITLGQDVFVAQERESSTDGVAEAVADVLQLSGAAATLAELRKNLLLPDSQTLKDVLLSCPKLDLPFIPFVEVVVLRDWGVAGYRKAAMHCWQSLRAELAAHPQASLAKNEWDAILYAAQRKNDVLMISRALQFFGF